jgi:hypothetical protein
MRRWALKRFIDRYLQEWKENPERLSLLLRGARQVGKTYSVRKLGSSFSEFVEINFELIPKAKDIFEKDLLPERIIRDLSLLLQKPINPGKTLLFFDEIQECPNAVKSLRYFYEMLPSLHVIAAGSLLDFIIEEIGLPVGRVSSFYMHPLSFFEFLQALEKDILIKEMIESPLTSSINEVAHSALLELLGEYFAIGGMPKAVQSWRAYRSPQKCFEIHQSLLSTYVQDFNKYAKKYQIKYLSLLFNQIPWHLGNLFKFSKIPGEFRKRELSPALDLLSTAGVIHKVYQNNGQGIPIGAGANPEKFKVIFLDIALSQSLLGLDLGSWLLQPEVEWLNKGALVEAFIGQEILAYSSLERKGDLYYWVKEEKGCQAEVDFLLQKNQAIIPIEVKSGKGSTLKSLQCFLQKHPSSPFGVRFSSQNTSKWENMYSFPLYMVYSFFQKSL